MEPVILGTAEVDITPDKSVELVGFYPVMSQGVLHKLSAQVAVWEQNQRKCCLVTIDHIGFLVAHADYLRTEIGKILSISKDGVMLCFAHTHSAPNDSAEETYFYEMCEKIKHAVKEAVKDMRPVLAGWGNAYVDIGVNRRAECDILDRRAGILKVEDAESGKLRLLILRLTAHGNVLKEDNKLISPDYFGTVRDLFGEKYGCPIMLTQGASGNVAPKYFKSKLTPPDANDPEKFCRSETALMDMAEEIYTQVKKVLPNIKVHTINHVSMYSVYHDFYAEVPSYQRALEVAKEAKEGAGIDGTMWLKEVDRLNKAGIKIQVDPTEIQYFCLDEGCFCGAANEIMCEFALHVKEQMKNEFFYLGGYTNGCTGYFPTEEEFDKGGYEVYWSMLFYFIYFGRVFPLRRESAAELIQVVIEGKKKI